MGIDPGSMKTGFGVLKLALDAQRENILHMNHGTIVLSDETDFSARLLGLGDSISQIVATYTPHIVVVEKVFLSKNVDSAFKLGHARGVVICESVRKGVQLAEYSTREVKKGVTGQGDADKATVQAALLQQLHIQKIVNFDASDALALAYHHCQKLIEKQRSQRLA